MQNKVNGFHWQKNVLINRANDFGFRKTMSEFSHFCVERTEPVGKGQLLESAIFTGRFDSASNWHPLVTPSIPRILKTNGTQGIPDPWKRFQALTNCISEDDTQHPIKKVKDRFQHEKKYPSSTSKFLWPGNLFELSGLVAFFQKTSHVDSKIHPILKPPRHPFFQGEKRPGTDFSGQDFGFRRWFRHAKGCLISRGWEENQLHKVCGEKTLTFCWVGWNWKWFFSLQTLPKKENVNGLITNPCHASGSIAQVEDPEGKPAGGVRVLQVNCISKIVCIYATTPILHIITYDIFGRLTVSSVYGISIVKCAQSPCRYEI